MRPKFLPWSSRFGIRPTLSGCEILVVSVSVGKLHNGEDSVKRGSLSTVQSQFKAMLPGKKLGRYSWVLVLQTKPQTFICSNRFRSYQGISDDTTVEPGALETCKPEKSFQAVPIMGDVSLTWILQWSSGLLSTK
jgi:hypothetical protein